MYNFVVLGQIPGTNVTISFGLWTLAAALAIAIITLLKLVRHRQWTVTAAGQKLAA